MSKDTIIICKHAGREIPWSDPVLAPNDPIAVTRAPCDIGKYEPYVVLVDDLACSFWFPESFESIPPGSFGNSTIGLFLKDALFEANEVSLVICINIYQAEI